MKILSNLTLSLLVCLFLGASSANAQDDLQDLARYLVQPGDTMSAIAVRFGISLQDLQNSNDVADPNQISAGEELVLPGVDWISGLIVGQLMPLGETLTSLSLKYRVTRGDFAKLNRISSPAQLHISYPILLPTERGENVSMGRGVVAPQTSLLEMAMVSGDNPWAIVEANNLPGSWAALPSQVLYLPAINQSGPGGLPSPIGDIFIGSTGFIQGRAAGLKVSAKETMPVLKGTLMDNDFQFFQSDGYDLVSVLGIHTLAVSGFYPLRLSGETNDGVVFSFSQLTKVEEGKFRYETLSVDPTLLDPEISDAEYSQIESLVSAVSPDKMWNGYFQVPSPYGDTINSYFGTRRSYNGSDYSYYHGGVDFGGGLGTQIFAPASGQVIFAGTLEVRGSATIIDHGWGVYTGYWHQSELLVNVGDNVQSGQVIGIVGNTGRSSGAHLHWELWVAGVQVDPLDWLTILFP